MVLSPIQEVRNICITQAATRIRENKTNPKGKEMDVVEALVVEVNKPFKIWLFFFGRGGARHDGNFRNLSNGKQLP